MQNPADDNFEPPPMSDALLDDETLADLFRDLRAATAIDEIVVKASPGRAEHAPAATLADAEQLLHDRAVRGVQIRYRHEGACWWDTLMPAPGGVRLVRIRHDL